MTEKHGRYLKLGINSKIKSVPGNKLSWSRDEIERLLKRFDQLSIKFIFLAVNFFKAPGSAFLLWKFPYKIPLFRILMPKVTPVYQNLLFISYVQVRGSQNLNNYRHNWLMFIIMQPSYRNLARGSLWRQKYNLLARSKVHIEINVFPML